MRAKSTRILTRSFAIGPKVPWSGGQTLVQGVRPGPPRMEDDPAQGRNAPIQFRLFRLVTVFLRLNYRTLKDGQTFFHAGKRRFQLYCERLLIVCKILYDKQSVP